MDVLRTGDLRHGDVLLFHGNGLLSRFIRFFDGSEYSHAAIYDGSKVVEALDDPGNAIFMHDVATSCATATYTHVYRYVSSDKRRLDIELPYEPVGTNVDDFKAHPEQYAYSQLLLLGLILSTRQLSLPGAAPLLRHFLDEAGEWLNARIDDGRECIICSELVYKCFYDTGRDEYQIDVAGVDPAKLAWFTPSAYLRAETALDADSQRMAESAAAFLGAYRSHKRGTPAPTEPLATVTAAASPETSPARALPEFVTPRDLATSPNLVLVGALQA